MYTNLCQVLPIEIFPDVRAVTSHNRLCRCCRKNNGIANAASTLWIKYVCLIWRHFDLFPVRDNPYFNFRIFAFIPPFGECLFNQPQNNANEFVCSRSIPYCSLAKRPDPPMSSERKTLHYKFQTSVRRNPHEQSDDIIIIIIVRNMLNTPPSADTDIPQKHFYYSKYCAIARASGVNGKSSQTACCTQRQQQPATERTRRSEGDEWLCGVVLYRL